MWGPREPISWKEPGLIHSLDTMFLCATDHWAQSRCSEKAMPSHSMIISPGHGFLQGTVARRGQVPELKEPGGLWRQTINHVLVTAASFSAGWGVVRRQVLQRGGQVKMMSLGQRPE